STETAARLALRITQAPYQQCGEGPAEASAGSGRYQPSGRTPVLTVTVVDEGTVVPADGCWLSTLPACSEFSVLWVIWRTWLTLPCQPLSRSVSTTSPGVRPTRFGMEIRSLCATCTVMVDPLSAFEPPAGLVESTSPRGRADCTSRISILNPAPSRFGWARSIS